MAKRAEIIIPFNYDETWIGGAYYITNLISALNLLPEREQPRLWIMSHEIDSFEFISKCTGYRHLKWLGPQHSAFLDPGELSRSRNQYVPGPLRRRAKFDLAFPHPIADQWPRTACWIPDFQDKRLPAFFSTQELADREARHRRYFTKFRHLVLSSKSARIDFEEFYPEAKMQVHVLPFAVFTNANRIALDFDELRARYDLPLRYFYCPNQFWIHKNHETVLRALGLLARQGMKINLVFSGKEYDARAPDHSDKMRALAKQLGIAENVRFLGFIPRNEQMEVFKHAVCIVQPSLFEGWSTVIEDAKSLSQYVLASRIPTHVEQICTNVEFFDPHDPQALASLLVRYSKLDPTRTPIDYATAQRAFARGFMDIVAAVRTED